MLPGRLGQDAVRDPLNRPRGPGPRQPTGHGAPQGAPSERPRRSTASTSASINSGATRKAPSIRDATLSPKLVFNRYSTATEASTTYRVTPSSWERVPRTSSSSDAAETPKTTLDRPVWRLRQSWRANSCRIAASTTSAHGAVEGTGMAPQALMQFRRNILDLQIHQSCF